MSDALPEELLGGWRLRAFEERGGEDERWERPLGDDAGGVAFFAPGVVSVHLHAPSAPEAALHNGGYFAFVTVRGLERSGETVRGELLYDVQGGYPAAHLATAGARPFDVIGDTLVLGDQRTWRHTWERIR